jgi:segregation and condensation protein A
MTQADHDDQHQAHPGTLPGGDYRVSLAEFQGPMDLLLHLVRRAEIDPAEIAVSAIAEQYARHVQRASQGQAGRVDVEVGGEFLVMAATLMEIKSRSLMPAADRPERPSAEHEAEDPGTQLVRQLLAYRDTRDAADGLEARRVQAERRWPLSRVGVHKAALLSAVNAAAEVDLEDLDIMDLVESFARIAAAVNFDRLGEHRVQFEDTPIELHARDILDRLDRAASTGRAPRLTFRELLAGTPRGEIIGLFIATLELTRQRRITIEHEAETGMILIQRREPDEDQPQPSTAQDSSPSDGPQ